MVLIRRLVPSERPLLRQFWIEHWAADFMVVGGRSFQVDQLEALVALDGDEWIGVATFYIEAAHCELMSLDSLRRNMGVGTALVKAVEQEARQAGCSLFKLVTTNDNTRALRFYQKLGFELAVFHLCAVEISRKLKPSIPETGDDGIPIRDEIELHLPLT